MPSATENAQQPACLLRFKRPVSAGELPARFTYPFYYEPHPLCMEAALELQEKLQTQRDWEHYFGYETNKTGEALGKMFGVLVVQTQAGQIGYIAAFSGKLAGGNHHPGFVPPVFDILEEDGFYRKGEAELNALNHRIEQLERDENQAALMQEYLRECAEADRQLQAEKERQKERKDERQRRRTLDPSLEMQLIEESKRDHFVLKDLKKHWKLRLETLKSLLDEQENDLQALRELRKNKSAELQQQIFDRYYFLNGSGEQKSLADIFQRNAGIPPPAGAGECAAPKLLQYAFLHGLRPVAMAEFWWGASPSGEIRKHGHFYPACRSKCEPILGHMLAGMNLDPNPMATGQNDGADIEILYDDEYLLVLNKPASLLSVPGKTTYDSVYLRIKQRYPQASGPMIVHRLDMSTSGLMLVAKSETVYKNLQSQFLKRSVKKRYVAVLEGIIEENSGIIDLPLRVDLEDRPRQMVCYEYGKAARTEWRVVSREAGRTRIHFFPITGRTHQLRVHAAHPKGLNTAIVGDEIYGRKGERLMLHAERLEFQHPVSGETVVVEAAAGF